MPSQLLVIVLHALPWWVPLIAALSLLAPVLARPTVKGWIGEMLLHVRLRRGLDRSRYRLFHNLILPTPDGTTQVDHVVVSTYGIFVIETKHYGGWIFGSERDRKWTQKFGRRSFSFQNPLRQNVKHVRALAELIGGDIGAGDKALFSLVVFSGSCRFKTAMPDNVTRARGCLAYIRARRAAVLSEAEVDAVVARIGNGRVAPSRAANAAHARHVQALVAQRKSGRSAAAAPVPATPTPTPAPAATRIEPQLPAEPAAPCCPRCAGALGDYTFRSGVKAGQAFRGCVRFPDCGYRIDLPAAPLSAASSCST